MSQINYKATSFTMLSLYKGVIGVPTNVSAWAIKIPPSQKSRYLGTCVLDVDEI